MYIYIYIVCFPDFLYLIFSIFLVESIDGTTMFSPSTTQTPEITTQTALTMVPETTPTFSGEIIEID